MMTEKKQNLWAHRFCALALAILMFFFLSIVVRTLTRQVLVKRLGMENAFTELILFDAQNLNDASKDEVVENNTIAKIDWERLYPFPFEEEDSSSSEAVPSVEAEKLNTYKERIQSIESKMNTYATDFLIGYKKLTELANRFEGIIRWSYWSYAEYNGTVELSDGHLTSYIGKRDIDRAADQMISFAEYCRENGVNFLYAQAPYKISETQDKGISGIVDFSNQNADAFIERLKEAQIDVYDFREQIDVEGLDHHSLFYRTDHHWRAETGLWAAQHLLQYLGQEYGYALEPELLDQQNFTSVLYPSWFLGSKGKKVTLSMTTPDDFTLLYPNYDVQMHFSSPDLDIDLDGDFSIVYDMRQVDELDYYGKNPYAAHMYGDRPLVRFENYQVSNNLHLLFIHESFGDCVLPFVSLGVKYVDSLDLRHFTGSVHSFIQESKPDAVIVMYNPNAIPGSFKIERDNHKALFDFR